MLHEQSKPGRWASVSAELEDFRRYLRADFQPLDIRKGYDYTWGDGPRYKEAREDRRFSECGVYLFFDATGRLLYVGKARYNFDKRIWAHKIRAAKFIDLIVFEERYAFLCVALEDFLICRLKPPFNFQGKDYAAACDGNSQPATASAVELHN